MAKKLVGLEKEYVDRAKLAGNTTTSEMAFVLFFAAWAGEPPLSIHAKYMQKREAVRLAIGFNPHDANGDEDANTPS